MASAASTSQASRRAQRLRRVLAVARRLLGSVCATAPLWAPAAAVADELEDFDAARRAFEAQDYARTIAVLEPLVGGDEVHLENELLVLESRKYLAAAYLFAGRRPEAERQFEALLAQDDGHQLDPVVFAAEVVDVFNAVRARFHARQRAAEEEARAREEAARHAEAERLVREQARLVRLTELAARETVETRNSRWIALLPFGAGQFQNGHSTLGYTLAVSEGLLVVASIVSFLLHDSLRDERPGTAERARATELEEAFRLSNWISTGALAATLLGGALDAELRFVPAHRTTRPRVLPEDGADAEAAAAEGLF